MKKMPIIVMLIMPYLLLGLLASGWSEHVWVVLTGMDIVMLLGALYAFFLPKMGFQGKDILFWCMLLKVCYIPVYCLNFVVALGSFVMLPVISMFIFLLDSFLLLCTSMYGVSGLVTCRKEGCFSKKTEILHLILQFFFCADVCSAIYCYTKARKWTVRQRE